MGSVAQLPRKVTFTDLQRLPEDGPRFELYDGEVWEMPSPLLRHQVVALRIARVCDDYAQRTGGLAAISPIDIVFSEHDVVQPDVVFFGPSRRALVDVDRVIRVPPDLVVEVLSPSTSRNDRGRKLRMFERYRVPEYWILDPVRRTVDVRALRANRYLVVQTATGSDRVTSPLFPDLVFSVADVFAVA